MSIETSGFDKKYSEMRTRFMCKYNSAMVPKLRKYEKEFKKIRYISYASYVLIILLVLVFYFLTPLIILI